MSPTCKATCPGSGQRPTGQWPWSQKVKDYWMPRETWGPVGILQRQWKILDRSQPGELGNPPWPKLSEAFTLRGCVHLLAMPSWQKSSARRPPCLQETTDGHDILPWAVGFTLSVGQATSGPEQGISAPRTSCRPIGGEVSASFSNWMIYRGSLIYQITTDACYVPTYASRRCPAAKCSSELIYPAGPGHFPPVLQTAIFNE